MFVNMAWSGIIYGMSLSLGGNDMRIMSSVLHVLAWMTAFFVKFMYTAFVVFAMYVDMSIIRRETYSIENASIVYTALEMKGH